MGVVGVHRITPAKGLSSSRLKTSCWINKLGHKLPSNEEWCFLIRQSGIAHQSNNKWQLSASLQGNVYVQEGETERLVRAGVGWGRSAVRHSPLNMLWPRNHSSWDCMPKTSVRWTGRGSWGDLAVNSWYGRQTHVFLSDVATGKFSIFQ